jgi:hypothetical protein
MMMNKNKSNAHPVAPTQRIARTIFATSLAVGCALALVACQQKEAPPRADVPAAENSGRKISIRPRIVAPDAETTATEFATTATDTSSWAIATSETQTTDTLANDTVTTTPAI